MRKTFKRGLATMLSILLVIASCSTISLAAEIPNQNATSEPIVQTGEVVVTDPELEGAVLLSTYSTRIYFINQTSTISGNATIPFTVGVPCPSNVCLVMSARYTDGHTGGASVRFSNYSFAVPVDGVSRVYDTSISLDIGKYNFYINGVNGQMTITIQLYALV